MELRRVDMPPCNGEYYVSRDGDVWTTHIWAHRLKDNEETVYNGIKLKKLERPKPSSKGYYSYKIENGTTRRLVFLHRIVAYAWCSPSENWAELEVDHIDGHPSNNNANNLRWVTHRENILLAQERGAWSHNNKPVVCFETKEEFPSAKAAFEKYKNPGQKSMSGLADVLKGRAATWHGKTFAYKNEASWL